MRHFGYTRLFVTVQGTIGGLAGMAHGIFAMQIGNKPAGGFILDPATGAFTLFPTYLSSGIAAVCVGLALILWTIGFIHREKGPTVFLLLCILLFLVGGGIAQVGFFLIAWLTSTRINRPPNWWPGDGSGNARRRWARAWPVCFVSGYLFLAIGIAIWLIYTPPGTPYPNHSAAYLACWFSLATGLILQLLTIISGFAWELDRAERKQSVP
jgi:hypothetical protein